MRYKHHQGIIKCFFCGSACEAHLSVFSNIGNNVRNAHDATFKRHGTRKYYEDLSPSNLLPPQTRKGWKITHLVSAGANSVLLTQVLHQVCKEGFLHEAVKHAHALCIVEKPTSRLLLINIIEEILSCMTKGVCPTRHDQEQLPRSNQS